MGFGSFKKAVAFYWIANRAFPSSFVQAWEAAHALPCLFGGAGMGAQRAAWEAE